MYCLPEALNALASFSQFVLQNEKTPVNPVTFLPTNALDPSAWVDAETAFNLAEKYGDQYTVGFVLTNNDPFIFVDIDHCLQADNRWSATAHEVLELCPGAAVQVSSGGDGLHIIAQGEPPLHKCKNTQLGLEFYHEKRILNISRNPVNGDAKTNLNGHISQLVDKYFQPVATVQDAEWTDGPIGVYNKNMRDDDYLISRALDHKGQPSGVGVFGTEEQKKQQLQNQTCPFRDLWEGNTAALTLYYPPQQNGPYDRSSADMALAKQLLFWTGLDCERTLKLMYKSALVRDKWETHASYLTDTIINGKRTQEKYYSVGDKEAKTGGITNPGEQIMPLSSQINYFENCFYIIELNRMLVPNGNLLDQSKFKATYGGYDFVIDSGNSKTTKNAWEAFTESRGYKFPKVDSITFRPDLETNEVFEREGKLFVNSYKPIDVRRVQGDPTPFLTHLAKVLPDSRDQQILLSYMAACCQHPGVKFQWAPLLQGTEGNGKTLFTTCVAHAVGQRYSHFPNASDIDNKFNGWMLNKLFIGIEDIYVPDHKLEVIEALKPMITSRQYDIQIKGADQVTCDICCNFMLNSNHKDGLRKTHNDRRFAPFFTAQQEAGHLERDGMVGDYFTDLYNWLRRDGYAIVADMLHNYKIPAEFNPAGQCHRAPTTSTTGEAILAGMGGVEAEILEAIESGRPGFSGGFVSGNKLAVLLKEIGAQRRIPANKRRKLMQTIGYDWHPVLTNGRLATKSSFDGSRTVLYVRLADTHLTMLDADSLLAVYDKTQQRAAFA